jgi:hypothetical protein
MATGRPQPPDAFERNQRIIADNATGMGGAIAKGAVRQGEVLLAGLLRCGHCGRKLQVHYSSKIGRYKLLWRSFEPWHGDGE